MNTARRANTRVNLIILLVMLLVGIFVSTSAGSLRAAYAVEEDTPAQATTESQTNLSITTLNPEVFTGTENVDFELALTNFSNVNEFGRSEWTVEAFLQPTPFESLTEMEHYLEGAGFPGWRLSADLIDPNVVSIDLANSSVTVPATIPLEQMPLLDPHTTGARGLTVRLSTKDAVYEAHTALIYQPYDDGPSTEVNVLIVSPITPELFAENRVVPENEAPLLGIPPEQQPTEQQTGEGQLLDTVQQLADLHGTTLAVLPSFLQSNLNATSPENGDAGEHPSTQTEVESEPAKSPEGSEAGQDTLPETSFELFQGKVLSEASEVVSLPAANADISLLAAASLNPLYTVAAQSRASSALTESEAAASSQAHIIDNVILASSSGFTLDSLSALSDNIIVSPTGWLTADDSHDTPITPTARVNVDPNTGTILSPAWPLIDDNFEVQPTDGGDDSDSTVSGVTVLDQWDPVNEALNSPLGTPAEELSVRQVLRAASLLVGLEDPEDQRSLATTLTLSAQHSGPQIVSRVQALLGNSWVSPISFAELLDSPLSNIAREPVPDMTVENDPELAQVNQELTPLSQDLQVAVSLATSSTAGTEMLGPYLTEVFAPSQPNLSTEERSKLAEQAQQSLADFTEMIKIGAMGTVNIVTRFTQFPVSIHNDGPADIMVDAYLLPSDPRLQSTSTVAATVPAHGQADVTVPVTAVGSGDVTVRIVVAAQDGTILDESAEITVRVRANWEDTVTIYIGVALITLFLFGVVRTIRKGRRRAPSPDHQMFTERFAAPNQQSQETTHDSLE